MFPFAIAVKHMIIRIIFTADNSGLAKELSSLLDGCYVPIQRKAGKFVFVAPKRREN
jgi:hypothetical protein